jgi:maltose O-acetyltransferase
MPGPDQRTEKQKMLAGDWYHPDGDELAADNLRADRLLRAYNVSGAHEAGNRAALLRDLLGSVGERVIVRPPFHCDYGYNIRLGHGAFINFGCVCLDVVGIAASFSTSSGSRWARAARSARLCRW